MVNFSKKGFAVSGAIIGFTFVMIVILLIVLQILLSTETARQLILQEINKTIPVRLSVKTHHLWLVAGGLDLTDILIEGTDNTPILLVDHLHVTIAFFPLLKGVLRFDNLLIENPAVWFRPDHTETLNLLNELTGPDDEKPSTPSDDFPVNILVNDFSLTGGRFHYAQADPPGTCDVEAIRLTLNNGDLLEQSGKFILNTGKIVINGPEIKTVLNELKLKGTLETGLLNPVSLVVRADNLNLGISGSVADIFTSPMIDISADLDSQWDALGPKTGLAGTLSSHMELKGGGVSAETLILNGRLKITSPDLSIAGIIAPLNVTLSADAGYQNQVMMLNRLDLNTSGVHLFATGDYDPATDEINSSVTLKAPDLAGVVWESGFGPFGGLLNLTAGISGKLKTPWIDARLQGKALSIKGTKTGNIDAAFKLKNGRLILEQFGLANGKSLITGSGSMDILDPATGTIHPDPALALTVAESTIYPEDFFEKIKGNFFISGRVDGSMKKPRGVFSLTGKKIDTGVQKVEDASLALSFDREKINLDRCVITIIPGQQIEATGMISPIDKNYDLHIVSNEISLNAIDSLRNLTQTSGKLVLDIEGRGCLEDPVFEGSVTVKDLNPKGGQIDDLHIDLGLGNNIVSISGDIGFNIEAFYNIDSMDFQAKAGFNKINLRPLFELLEHQDAGGQLTGSIQAEGNAGRPELIVASADIEELSMYHDGIGVIQADAFHTAFENKVLTIPGIHLNFPEKGFFDMSGKGTLGGSIDFSATGTIPAEAIRIFTDDYQEVTGTVRLAGSLKGTFDTPLVASQITLVSLGLTVPELMQRLHGVHGQIAVTPQAVSVDEIRGMLDTGEFVLSGNLTMKNFMPAYLEAKLSSTALPVNIPDSMEMLLNTELSVRGTPEDSLIEGGIVILEGRYYKDVSLTLLKNIGRKTRRYQPIKKEIDLPFLNDPELKISITNRKPLDIDNNIAVMTLHPDLSLYGTINRPLISGRASVPSGIIFYQNKDFQITKGVVDFINPYKIEPAIDITGQVEIREWTIYLEVSGKPDNLEFKLSSEPAEEHWNILSLLTLGKTAEELTESGSSDNPISPKQRIADMLARSLQEKIQSETSFDSIEMKYSEGIEKDDPDDIKVTVGKQLVERLTLKYGVETKDGVTVQSAGSEYKLLESLLMKAFHDTEGDFGGELVFRLEFR